MTKEHIGVFILLYGAFSFFTGIIGLMFGIQEVPEKLATELWEKPWRLNSPLKMLMFFIFHGVFLFAFLNWAVKGYEKWWETNKKTQSFEKKWKAFWVKELW